MDRRAFLRSAGQLSLAMGASGLLAEDRVLTLAAAGDCLITRRLSNLGGEKTLMEILRQADAAFGNLEMTLADGDAAPSATGACGDLNLRAGSFIAEELKWAGFKIVGLANNHALDYGAEGMFATARKLEAVGLAHAGTGRNLAEARAPAYYDSPRGRIALVACASTFRNGSPAAEGNGEIPGRPGINPLRVRATYRVEPEQLEALKKIAAALSLQEGGLIPQADPEAFHFLTGRFTAGSPAGVLTQAEERDVKEIAATVRRAGRNADLVVVGIHAHEADRDRDLPAKFLRPFAHACIDAGADVFIGHGPHVLRALEIYKNRPIFYSLGNFIFEAESMEQIPEEIYRTCGLPGADPSDFFDRAMKSFADAVFWESVVPVAAFRNRSLAELKLYPVTLQPELPRSERGSPELATGPKAREILERLAKLSEPYGTRIVSAGGIGTVQL